MKPTLIALLFVAAVTASPWPWAQPQADLVSASGKKPINRTKTNRTRKNPHKEPTPTFKAACDCPKAIVPVNLLNENEKCQFQLSHDLGCYLKAKGGCPSPAPACGLGVINAIPYI